MQRSNHINMHRWILADKNKQTTVLCSHCSYEQYDTLYIRKQWLEKDFGKITKCDRCGESILLEGRQIF